MEEILDDIFKATLNLCEKLPSEDLSHKDAIKYVRLLAYNCIEGDFIDAFLDDSDKMLSIMLGEDDGAQYFTSLEQRPKVRVAGATQNKIDKSAAIGFVEAALKEFAQKHEIKDEEAKFREIVDPDDLSPEELEDMLEYIHHVSESASARSRPLQPTCIGGKLGFWRTDYEWYKKDKEHGCKEKVERLVAQRLIPEVPEHRLNEVCDDTDSVTFQLKNTKKENDLRENIKKLESDPNNAKLLYAVGRSYLCFKKEDKKAFHYLLRAFQITRDVCTGKDILSCGWRLGKDCHQSELHTFQQAFEATPTREIGELVLACLKGLQREEEFKAFCYKHIKLLFLRTTPAPEYVESLYWGQKGPEPTK